MDAGSPERYVRQLALPGFGADAQARLTASRVLVIGAGGLGSTVIPALAAAGVGAIGIVDDDRVELSNLHRQLIHGTADVGRSKAQSAADAVAALNPATRVIPIAERITAANALALLADYDIVVDGCDNFPTRYLADDAGTLTNVPVVWGAVSQYGGQTGLSWASRGPTYRDLFPVPPAPGSVLSCEVGGVLPTVVATIGSLMATEAIKVITGVGTPALGTVTTYDALSGSFRSLSYSKDPTASPVTGLIDYELFCGLVSVSPAELAARTDEFTLLDVREPWEAEIAALDGAVLIPLGTLEGGLDRLDPRRPVVVYCHHGVRSASARALLASHGFAASHLAGGIDAWARDLDPAMARY
jgi:molybdopterin/thiamine biosynthesis adenylyltransferase/rhodanese-related sulfurtransferase